MFMLVCMQLRSWCAHTHNGNAMCIFMKNICIYILWLQVCYLHIHVYMFIINIKRLHNAYNQHKKAAQCYVYGMCLHMNINVTFDWIWNAERALMHAIRRMERQRLLHFMLRILIKFWSNEPSSVLLAGQSFMKERMIQLCNLLY